MADVLAVAAGWADMDELAAAFPRVRPDRLAAVVKFLAAYPVAVAAYLRARVGCAPDPADPTDVLTTSPPPASPRPDPAE